MIKTLQELSEEGKNPCQVCKNWRDCPYREGKDWYEYLEIRYCFYQVMWIIENADTLRSNWPPNPDGTGYIDSAIHTGYASEASFAKSIIIIAEVEYRLRRCRVDGKLLRAEIIAGLDLSEESKSALRYCSGWRRKQMSYLNWKKQSKYRGDIR